MRLNLVFYCCTPTLSERHIHFLFLDFQSFQLSSVYLHYFNKSCHSFKSTQVPSSMLISFKCCAICSSWDAWCSCFLPSAHFPTIQKKYMHILHFSLLVTLWYFLTTWLMLGEDNSRMSTRARIIADICLA